MKISSFLPPTANEKMGPSRKLTRPEETIKGPLRARARHANGSCSHRALVGLYVVRTVRTCKRTHAPDNDELGYLWRHIRRVCALTMRALLRASL